MINQQAFMKISWGTVPHFQGGVTLQYQWHHKFFMVQKYFFLWGHEKFLQKGEGRQTVFELEKTGFRGPPFNICQLMGVKEQRQIFKSRRDFYYWTWCMWKFLALWLVRPIVAKPKAKTNLTSYIIDVVWDGRLRYNSTNLIDVCLHQSSLTEWGKNVNRHVTLRQEIEPASTW